MRTLHRAAALCFALSLSLSAGCSSGSGTSTPPPTPEPLLALSAASLSFDATLGGANPAAQTVGVTNSGTGTLTAPSTSVAYAGSSGWLAAVVVPGGEPGTYLVSVQPTCGALGAGTHQASVSIHSAGALNTPGQVAVSLTIVDPAQPSIGLSPASLSFTAIAGGAAPSAEQVSVSNGGGASLAVPTATVEYGSGAGWLSTSVSGSVAPYTLAVTPAISGLAAGTYSATIRVASAGATNSPRSLGVTLTLVPPLAACKAEGVACGGAAECCSAICGPDGCGPAKFCGSAGSPCATDNDCCSMSCTGAGTPGATCAPAPCLTVGASCAAGSECCSGTCSGNVCAALPPGPTNSTCTTLSERCTTSSQCCSNHCEGADATAGTPGWCAPAYTCNASGDICYRPEDCCSGLCAQTAGQPGRCDDASGDCTQDGIPCENDSNCCTKKCVDLGTGTKVCQPSGGCRMTGNYCDSTASCCGGTNEADPGLQSTYQVFCDGPGQHPGATEWDTRTQDSRTCTGGTACNPPGNICGYKASQNCCYEGTGSGKAVCKPDSNNILRCFGGPVNETCPSGWDANNPLCCKESGAVCQFRDQCCGGAPCVPDAAGILRCAAPPDACLARDAECAPATPDPCCDGTTCVPTEGSSLGGFCTPPVACLDDGLACSTTGTGPDACCSGLCVPSSPGGTTGACAACAPNGGGCTNDSQCCSGVCDPEAEVCLALCVGESGSCTVDADCCGGLACDVPPGATSGTCKGGGTTCAGTGQICAVDGDCCNAGAGETCTGGVCTPPPSCSSAAELCTFGGNECCAGLTCFTVGAGSELVPCGAGDACFCGDTAACLPAGGVCTWGVPCCAGLSCATVGTGSSCDPENPDGCTCVAQ